MDFLRFIFLRHRIAALLLAVAMAAIVWMGAGFVREALYFADPAHQRQDLEPWMSPRYVGKSWDLPPEVIMGIMDLEPGEGRQTLADVSAELGISLDELQRRVAYARGEIDLRRFLNLPPGPPEGLDDD
jgi:hypothetical protein